MGTVRGREVASARCSIVRECGNEACVFKMLFRGYKPVARDDMERRRNAEIERVNGKGFFPQWKVVGAGEIVNLVCENFQEKR